MQNAVVLAVTFERPANFDLAAHWKSATAQLQQKRRQFRATLALAPDAAVSLSRWCRVSAGSGGAAGASGEVVGASCPFENSEEARFVALGLGARVQVLEPVSLRDQVREEMVAAIRGWE